MKGKGFSISIPDTSQVTKESTLDPTECVYYTQ